MLHWNSWWMPTEPDGKTALETTPALKEPWPAEQWMAWQTLAWQQVLSTSHAWWNMAAAGWSPSWLLPAPQPEASLAANDPVASPRAPRTRRPGKARSR
jgi:hypothetical protein